MYACDVASIQEQAAQSFSGMILNEGTNHKKSL
jgi:hypothetical protein